MWFSWQNATLPNGKEKLQKLTFQGSFDDTFSELKLQTLTFLMHHFVKEKQSAAFKSNQDFSDTNFNTAVLQIDFAENYSTFYQDEVQSTHWEKTQITIFTAALWQKNECHSVVVVSDDDDEVFRVPKAEIKNEISLKSIKVLLDNAQSLPRIFKAYFFKNTKGIVELQTYRDQMIEIQDKIIKSQNKIAQNSALELKHGMFVIVPYKFATSFSKTQIVKKMLAVIIGVTDNVQIQYAKSFGGSKKRFKLTPNDKGHVANSDILDVLKCPTLKGDVHEFEKELDHRKLSYCTVYDC